MNTVKEKKRTDFAAQAERSVASLRYVGLSSILHAEIVPIRMLSDADNRGLLLWIIAGIKHAADIEADVVNVSLRGRLDHSKPDEVFNSNILEIYVWMRAYP